MGMAFLEVGGAGQVPEQNEFSQSCWLEAPQHASIAAVPTFGHQDRSHGRQFFHGMGWGRGWCDSGSSAMMAEWHKGSFACLLLCGRFLTGCEPGTLFCSIRCYPLGQFSSDEMMLINFGSILIIYQDVALIFEFTWIIFYILITL